MKFKFKSIWIVGSSIVKHAFVRARCNGTVNMELGRHAASVWWQGQSGLRWGKLESKLNTLLRYEDSPDMLVIHCGGNDIGIGSCKSIKLRKCMESTIINISKTLPNTRIVCHKYSLDINGDLLWNKKVKSNKSKDK